MNGRRVGEEEEEEDERGTLKLKHLYTSKWLEKGGDFWLGGMEYSSKSIELRYHHHSPDYSAVNGGMHQAVLNSGLPGEDEKDYDFVESGGGFQVSE